MRPEWLEKGGRETKEQLVLPAGVTGFFGPGDIRVNPMCPKEFRRLCHAFARENRGSVTAWDEDLRGKSFYAAEISWGERFWLLCNPWFPRAAFAVQAEYGAVVFRDPPACRSPWLGCPVLTREALAESCWSPGVLSALTPAEMEQIRYWKPQTVGEVLFHFWD